MICHYTNTNTNTTAICDSSVSGKTSILVVGKEPGMSKVSKARQSGGKTKLLSVMELMDLIKGN